MRFDHWIESVYKLDIQLRFESGRAGQSRAEMGKGWRKKKRSEAKVK